MITSKKICGICEKYLDTRKISGHDVPVYTNPTVDDIKELVKNNVSSVRFIVKMDTKTVYVWDGMVAIHRQIMPLLNIKYSTESDFIGEGIVSNNQIKFKSADSINTFLEMVTGPPWKSATIQQIKQKQMEKLQDNWFYQYLSKDWSFADKYINGLSSFISKTKEKVIQYFKEKEKEKEKA